MFTDYSELVGKGSASVKIPRSDSFTVMDRDNNTPLAATAQNLTFLFDEIVLDQSRYVFYVIPGDVEVDAKPSYEQTAASRAASAHGRNMDIVRIDELWRGADVTRDVDYISGTSDFEDTVLKMIEAADEAEMMDDGGRYILIRPEQRREALMVANFVQADRYGNNIALMSGELGQVYGCRFIMTTHVGTVDGGGTAGTWGDGKMVLCHRESLGFAYHRRPSTDSDKAIEFGAGSMKHTWDVKYGLKVLQDGKLIVRAYAI